MNVLKSSGLSDFKSCSIEASLISSTSNKKIGSFLTEALGHPSLFGSEFVLMYTRVRMASSSFPSDPNCFSFAGCSFFIYFPVELHMCYERRAEF